MTTTIHDVENENIEYTTEEMASSPSTIYFIMVAWINVTLTAVHTGFNKLKLYTYIYIQVLIN